MKVKIDYAANNNVDLIVIGIRGRTGLKRFLMGSRCPVLLVRWWLLLAPLPLVRFPESIRIVVKKLFT